MTSLPARLLLAVVSGLATALAFEPFALPYLAPVGVAGATLAAVRTTAGRGLLVGLAFGLGYMGLLLPWLQVIHPAAWPALAVLEALFYAVGGLAVTTVTRLRWWPVWAAAVWLGVEALRGIVPFGGFPWGRLGFAVVDTPAMGSVAYLGVPGTSFLVALLGTSLAWSLAAGPKRLPRRVAAPVVAVAAALVTSVLPVPAAVGSDRDTGALRVAAVQGDVPGVGLDAFSERRAVLDNHVRATLELAGRVETGATPPPDLVIWPENSSDIDPFADDSVRADVARAARAIGAPLLMGAAVGERAEDGWHNRAVVWGPDGEPGEFYDKRRPVPFGEYVPLRALLASRVSALDQIPTDMIRGDRAGVLDVDDAVLGVLMCFEVAYDPMVRDLVDGGANLLVVPTNNATYIGTGQVEQQFAMSRVRAVETGRSVVVASTNGISGFIAPDGTVVERAPQRETVVLEHAVELRSGRTPAMLLGGWVELGLAVVGGLAAVVGLLLGYRRRAPGEDRQRHDGHEGHEGVRA